MDEERRASSTRSGASTIPGNRNLKLVPLPETASFFKSSREAMKLSSRPVCTLEQYIDFYSCVDRDKALSSDEGRGRGCRLGVKNDHFSGATYYNVIRQYIGGPGVEPGNTLSNRKSELNRRLDEITSALKGTPGVEGLETKIDHIRKKLELQEGLVLTGFGPNGRKTFRSIRPGDTVTQADLPDSRKDWQALFIDYLTEIEGVAPQTGEG